MADLNEVRLIGRLTRDPELRSTTTGQMVCSFGLATGRKYRGPDGLMREETVFVDITCWGKLAEVVSRYLKKGRQVFVGGRLKYDTWEDKQTGQKRSKLSVTADNIQFLDRKDDPIISSLNEPTSNTSLQSTPQNISQSGNQHSISTKPNTLSNQPNFESQSLGSSSSNTSKTISQDPMKISQNLSSSINMDQLPPDPFNKNTDPFNKNKSSNNIGDIDFPEEPTWTPPEPEKNLDEPPF